MSKRIDTSIIHEEGTFSDLNIYDRNEIKSITSQDKLNTEYQENIGNISWENIKEANIEVPVIKVFDVAAYILEQKGRMSTMKLQKLVYYSQAWSLVWDEKPLFAEEIEAWANGPVVRNLFDYHRGRYELSSIPIGNPRLLNQEQQETVEAVLQYYSDRPAQWLIDLTHMEEPWKQARKGLQPLERGNSVISFDSMADYYSSLSVLEDFEDEEKT